MLPCGSMVIKTQGGEDVRLRQMLICLVLIISLLSGALFEARYQALGSLQNDPQMILVATQDILFSVTQAIGRTLVMAKIYSALIIGTLYTLAWHDIRAP